MFIQYQNVRIRCISKTYSTKVYEIGYIFLSRLSVTLGGHSSEEETCLASVTYYPKIDLGMRKIFLKFAINRYRFPVHLFDFSSWMLLDDPNCGIF